MVDERLFSYDIFKVKQAIAEGADVNATDSQKWPPLLAAIFNDWHQIARILLAAGADPDASDDLGRSTLRLAVLHNDLSTIRLLIRSGAQVNSHSPEYLLKDTVIAFQWEATSELLSAGAEYLYLFCNMHGKTLSNDIDPHVWCALAGMVCPQSALIQALLLNEQNTANELIRSGHDLSLTATGGRTALMIAVALDQTAIVKRLIKSGASVNEVDDTGNSALHFALKYRRVEIARLLLAAGADPGITNDEGESPAVMKLRQERPELFRLELRVG
jgi:ankyrin repeat protein